MRLASRTLTALTASALLAAGILTAELPAQAETGGAAAATTTDASGQCAPSGDGTTPSRAVQDACNDHAMGSSLEAQATPAASPQLRSAAAAPAAGASPSSGFLKGFDVSGWQGATPDWSGLAAKGYKFVFIKANEATGVYNDYFPQQWVDAGAAGLIRGVYDFARPDLVSGAAEANAFYQNGAAMAAGDAGTLPPVIDLETPSAGTPACSNLSQSGMVSWISSYISTLTSLTGRQPLIYSNANWWSTCTGNTTAFASRAKLWIANWVTGVTNPTPFPGWSSWTFWQYSDALTDNPTGGDIDVFNGSALSALQSVARYPRLSGTDRFATSASIGQNFLTAARTGTTTPTPGGTVYVANGWSFPDALSGGAAAGLVNAPILLVSATSIPTTVRREITALSPTNIVILGGTTSVSSSVSSALVGLTKSKSASAVTRIGGADRFATSAAVATSKFSPGVANLYIASGATWPDALSGAAASAAASTSGPILLVQPGSIPAATAAALTTLKPKKITILGGPTAVSAGVASQLAKYTTSTVARLSGADRFATSAAIATSKFPVGVSVAYVVSGVDFPDALSAAPLSALTAGAPVLLTQRTTIPSSVSAALKTLKPKSIIVIGGSASVAASVQSALASYVVQ
ncbi:cell wall-binding repeat-containing protein [Gryllotalpicola koreensis]|uniref:Uncharacterized protein n=1 Tax=Gryllotalpicola koreensis TaxID=993086 RepID=A0ABP7ZTB3_9MICO